MERPSLSSKYFHEFKHLRSLAEIKADILALETSSLEAEMEKKVRETYELFDAKRKRYEAIEADQVDLSELKQLEEKIEKIK